jgi:hypothetical protein
MEEPIIEPYDEARWFGWDSPTMGSSAGYCADRGG